MGWEDVAWVGNNAAYGQVIADHESGEGYYAFTHMAKIYPDDDKSPAVQAWWDQYVALYGDEPGIAAMEGYRAAEHYKIEANIDDMSPEAYEPLMDHLMAAGASDVHVTPIVMKKSRPAINLSVLCEAERVDALADAVLNEVEASAGLEHPAHLLQRLADVGDAA